MIYGRYPLQWPLASGSKWTVELTRSGLFTMTRRVRQFLLSASDRRVPSKLQRRIRRWNNIHQSKLVSMLLANHRLAPSDSSDLMSTSGRVTEADGAGA